MAEELVRALVSSGPVWDIACGRGALLQAVRAVRDDLPLVGFDLDAVALAAAKSALRDARLKTVDSLAEPISSLERIGGGRPDAIILNPPWGASLTVPRETLQRGFRTAFGQFDTYDVFVERALDLLSSGGAFALIIPDSLLASEHARLRSILVEETELHLVARLGEGFFDSVYRGVMVVIGLNVRPRKTHTVRCFRLGPQDRRAVLSGDVRLGETAEHLAHAVPQSRFSESATFRIELDVREDERQHLRPFAEIERLPWRDLLSSARGVELSKHGFVVTCPACSTAAPKPRRPRPLTCATCGTPFNSAEAALEQIVVRGVRRTEANWMPLIAGEDVRRYYAAPSRVIRTDVAGIAYKDPAVYKGPKLLVRKTGVGISAAVDTTDALTTQVVFHYKPQPGQSSTLLHYLAGVLNSRFMLAYYLRTHGEAEWRSHPYVTQQIIESLPVPAPVAENRSIVRRIANASRRRSALRSETLASELRIEKLVAELFGFDRADWEWALGVLHSAQQLEAIRELTLPLQTAIAIS